MPEYTCRVNQLKHSGAVMEMRGRHSRVCLVVDRQIHFTAGKLDLTEAELERIAGLDRGYRTIAGDFWVVKGTPWTRQSIWDEA